MFKVNNKDTSIRKVNDNVKNKDTVDVALASLLLTSNTFCFLLHCFCLPHVSNVFERITYHQLNDYMTDKLSKQLTGFRKNHNTQHCLSCMLEVRKKVLDKGGYICAILMDLSNAFDTLNHDLLIAKLGTYRFQTDALRYMKSYLTNTK